MGFREDVKLGITRVSRLFLGDDNGQLGEEVTDTLTDLGTNLVSTAAEIDAVVSGGGGPSLEVPIITDERLSGGIYEFEFLCVNGLIGILQPGICTLRVSAFDLITSIRATALEQSLGDFQYAVLLNGDGPPVFVTDPTQAVLDIPIPAGTTQIDVWVQGPSGNSYPVVATYVLNQDNTIAPCDVP